MIRSRKYERKHGVCEYMSVMQSKVIDYKLISDSFCFSRSNVSFRF